MIVFVLGLINHEIVAAELNIIKFKKLEINTQTQQFKKFGNDISGTIEGMRYINRFYEFSEDNKLKGLIEVFGFDVVSYHGRANAWFRNLVFNQKNETACINSNKNIFFEKNDNHKKVSCLNIRIIKKDELSSPNFNQQEHIPFFQRKSIINKFIKKNNLLVSEEMIRAEHYFYNNGTIRWFFFTSKVNINSVKDVNKFIAYAIKNHQESEDKLRLKEKFSIAFKDADNKKIVEAENKKTKIAKVEPDQRQKAATVDVTLVTKKVKVTKTEELKPKKTNQQTVAAENKKTLIAKVEEPKQEEFKPKKTNQQTVAAENKKTLIAKVEEPKQEEFKPKKTNQDNEAPVIVIAETITVNDSSYEFKGKVNDKAKTIYVEVDGRSVEVKKGQFVVKGYSPIDKEISITAFDQWGNRSEAKIVKLTIDIKDTSIAEKLEPLNPSKIKSKSSNNKVALIIGIENYLESPNATYANLDAKYFFDYARKGFGVKKQNINLLVDEQATFVKTNKVLTKWLRSKIKSGETELIIFFAGHGLASNDGKELYLLPQDSDPDLLARTALSRTELFKEIIALNPKGVTMFLDTCYSGVSRDEKTLLASARPVRIIADEQVTPNNFTIFSASQLDQISSGFKEAKHGIFSYYLMKGLEGKADANKDKDITNGELLAYMDENVAQKASELGRQQNPSLAGDPDKILMSYR